MNYFCERLKTERKKLGLNQEEFAALGGVKKGAQFNYENGVRMPDAQYLIALAAAGVDVLYVLTGEISPAFLLQDEGVVIDGYRSLDARGKSGVTALINELAVKRKLKK